MSVGEADGLRNMRKASPHTSVPAKGSSKMRGNFRNKLGLCFFLLTGNYWRATKYTLGGMGTFLILWDCLNAFANISRIDEMGWDWNHKMSFTVLSPWHRHVGYRVWGVQLTLMTTVQVPKPTPPPNQLRYFRSPICTTPKEKKEQQKSKIKKKPSWSAILFRAGFSKANIVLPQFKTFSVFKFAFSSTVHSLETSPSLERKVRFSSRRSPLSLGYKPKTVTSCPWKHTPVV